MGIWLSPDVGRLLGLHGHIDMMMEENPAIATATIWRLLADDHGVVVAYPTLRAYVTSHRLAADINAGHTEFSTP